MARHAFVRFVPAMLIPQPRTSSVMLVVNLVHSLIWHWVCWIARKLQEERGNGGNRTCISRSDSDVYLRQARCGVLLQTNRSVTSHRIGSRKETKRPYRRKLMRHAPQSCVCSISYSSARSLLYQHFEVVVQTKCFSGSLPLLAGLPAFDIPASITSAGTVQVVRACPHRTSLYLRASRFTRKTLPTSCYRATMARS